MNRRDFLRSFALSAAGLYVAPDLLSEPRRRIFPVGIDLRGTGTYTNPLWVASNNFFVKLNERDLAEYFSWVPESGALRLHVP